MLRRLKRPSLWLVAVVLMVSAGYTAGYMLAPPRPAAVSLTLPHAPSEAPQPVAPLETPVEEEA